MSFKSNPHESLPDLSAMCNLPTLALSEKDRWYTMRKHKAMQSVSFTHTCTYILHSMLASGPVFPDEKFYAQNILCLSSVSYKFASVAPQSMSKSRPCRQGSVLSRCPGFVIRYMYTYHMLLGILTPEDSHQLPSIQRKRHTALAGLASLVFPHPRRQYP